MRKEEAAGKRAGILRALKADPTLTAAQLKERFRVTHDFIYRTAKAAGIKLEAREILTRKDVADFALPKDPSWGHRGTIP